jgi:polygalacturonase
MQRSFTMQRSLFTLALPVIAFTLSAAAPFSAAQDTRTVTEPKIPPFCTALQANLVAVNGGIAPRDESKLDTERIQKAIDGCGKGQAVALQVRKRLWHDKADAFLSGPLELREGVTLVVDKDVTLFESIDPQVLQDSPGSCGIVSDAPIVGCKPFISVSHVSGAGIMGDGVIDGRGGVKMLGKEKSAWELAEQARPGGGQRVSKMIAANHADNFTLYRITLKNSQNFHVTYNGGDGFTVWGIKIDTPTKLARNTDGIDPGAGAKDITITNSYLKDGDDDVAIKGGTGGVTNMTVSHNHFYGRYGMSIGSATFGGVSRIRVFDLSIDGSISGILIKSSSNRGGLVQDVSYEDVCIRNATYPLWIDTQYEMNLGAPGTKYPDERDITLRNVRVSGGGRVWLRGYSSDHRFALNLDGVMVTDSAKYDYALQHGEFKLGPGPVNLTLAGDDTTVTGSAGSGTLASCAEKFVPFPH